MRRRAPCRPARCGIKRGHRAERRRYSVYGAGRDMADEDSIRQALIVQPPVHDRGVAPVVKARAEAAGYAPNQVAGHSLSARFLTDAARRGANIFKMRVESRHKSLDVLSGYVRNHELFADHAGERFL